MSTRILAGIVALGSLAGPAIAADIIRAPILAAPARVQLPLAGYLEFYGAHGRSDAYFGPENDPWLGLGGAGRLNGG